MGIVYKFSARFNAKEVAGVMEGFSYVGAGGTRQLDTAAAVQIFTLLLTTGRSPLAGFVLHMDAPADDSGLDKNAFRFDCQWGAIDRDGLLSFQICQAQLISYYSAFPVLGVQYVFVKGTEPFNARYL